ncbi:Hypothetical predicted protein [Mytilus galloprovincialis]|uniref:Uncharacterized protein n=1 Tax=Mytilus galloprovincialis TaxID=29158 RepID=A0A8B6EJM7_MYTGA|nr:Hypothetical predicted protein [Mytilus galloprovincialis]
MSDEEVQSSPECAPARSHRSEDDNPTSIPTADAFSLFSTGHWSSNCPEISGLTTPAVPNEPPKDTLVLSKIYKPSSYTIAREALGAIGLDKNNLVCIVYEEEALLNRKQRCFRYAFQS